MNRCKAIWPSTSSTLNMEYSYTDRDLEEFEVDMSVFQSFKLLEWNWNWNKKNCGIV